MDTHTWWLIHNSCLSTDVFPKLQFFLQMYSKVQHLNYTLVLILHNKIYEQCWGIGDTASVVVAVIFYYFLHIQRYYKLLKDYVLAFTVTVMSCWFSPQTTQYDTIFNVLCDWLETIVTGLTESCKYPLSISKMKENFFALKFTEVNF